jgi:hypothetical protein
MDSPRSDGGGRRSPFASDVCSQPIFNSMGLAVSDMNPTSPGRSWKAGAFSLLPPGTRKPVIGVTLPHIYALLGKGGPRRAFLPTPRPCVAGGMREGARPRSHFTIAVRAERLASAVTGPAALRCSQQFAAPRPRRASAEDCGKGLLTLPSISRYSTFAQMKPVRACGSFPLSCCCLV